MTSFRRHDAQVTLCKAAKTRVTITLVKTFPDYPPAVDAFDLLQIFNANLFAQPLVEVNLLTTKLKTIAYGAARLGKHFVQIPLKFHASPV